jgi:hypothetical protein
VIVETPQSSQASNITVSFQSELSIIELIMLVVYVCPLLIRAQGCSLSFPLGITQTTEGRLPFSVALK